VSFFITFFGLLLLFILFLVIPLQFGAHYVKTTNKKSFHIYFSLFGILFRVPIRISDDKRTNQKKDKTKKNQNKSSDASFTFEDFRCLVENLEEVVTVSKAELIEILAYVRKHLSCKEIDFRIAHGLGDAAKTGITTGAVWTSGTLLLKLIDTLIGIKKIHMDVFPDFQGKRFEISAKAIFVMRPIHFIFIYRRIRKTIKFIKTKISIKIKAV